MDTIADKVVQRANTMESDRSMHVSVWLKCLNYSYPLLANGFYGTSITAQDGLSKMGELNDSTTTESVRVFTSHLVDGMVPSNQVWFGLSVPGASDDDKQWLSEAAKTIWRNIHTANFDSTAYESCLMAICAGWFVMYAEEGENGGYHFEQWPIPECYVASSKPGGKVDIIYRRFQYTAEQAMEKYGDALSDEVKDLIEKGKQNEKVEFVHAIYPRRLSVSNPRLAKNLPFASVHVEYKTKKLLKESGFHEFPCAVPRYNLIPGTPYAVGPVFEAIADSATLNKIKEMEMANMDMAIGGLWVAEDDGVINPRAIKIGPRRVIVANSVDSIKPLQPSTNFQVAFMSEEKLQAQIRKILLADILPPLEGQPRTAAEIHMRMQYIRQMLGPVFGRLQAEWLQTLIERCFGIAFRAGVLGQPPSSLANKVMSVKYESPLARAQKMADVNAIDQYVAGLVQASAVDPSVMDNVNLDKAARYRGEALGVPTEIIPTTDEIKEKRANREQAQQQMQQEQLGMNIAQEAGTAAAKKLITGGA